MTTTLFIDYVARNPLYRRDSDDDPIDSPVFEQKSCSSAQGLRDGLLAALIHSLHVQRQFVLSVCAFRLSTSVLKLSSIANRLG